MTGPVRRVLFLHGLGCHVSMWDDVVAALDPGTEALDVVLPWHAGGQPGWSHRGDPADMLVDAVGPALPVDLVVAHSFSATLLLEVMADGRLPQLPAVLACPFHKASARQFDWETARHHLVDFHEIFAEALRLRRGGVGADRVAAAALRTRDHVGPYGWLRHFEAYLRSPFVDLAAITAPQLVVAGDSDIAVDAADTTRLADALPAGRSRVLPGCGHFPMVQRPAEFAAAVDAFAADLDRDPHDRRHLLELT